MRELVEVPRSSFYARFNHTPSARELADAELLDVIRDIYRRSRRTYGVPRVYGQTAAVEPDDDPPVGNRQCERCAMPNAEPSPSPGPPRRAITVWPTRRPGAIAQRFAKSRHSTHTWVVETS